jgi:two-component system, NtrC family, response regulator AtoC
LGIYGTVGGLIMAEGFKIVVADPNPNVRRFLARELMNSGYRVVTVKDYKNLFRCITGKIPPDLIIIEPNLPKSSGLDALRRINRLNPRIPTIVYSRLVEPDRHSEVRKAEAFIPKRKDPVLLLSSLEVLLQRH